MNFTKTTFQNVPIPHLTCTMKLELSEGPVTTNLVNMRFSSHEFIPEPNVALTKELAYSKALRCTFFWEWKNSCSSKFVQLELLNEAKSRTSKKLCSLRFSLNKFMHLKSFWTLFKKVHCQGPCSLRPCIWRPYCISNAC